MSTTENDALLKLASVAQVGGHVRKSKKGEATFVNAYIRRVLDSFGSGADADTKRGMFQSRLRALRATKGVIGVAEIRRILEEISATDRTKKKKKTVSLSAVDDLREKLNRV